MSPEADEQAKRIEDHRRWRLARQIVEDNSGPAQRLLNDTRERPAMSVALAFGVGMILGLVIRK